MGRTLLAHRAEEPTGKPVAASGADDKEVGALSCCDERRRGWSRHNLPPDRDVAAGYLGQTALEHLLWPAGEALSGMGKACDGEAVGSQVRLREGVDDMKGGMPNPGLAQGPTQGLARITRAIDSDDDASRCFLGHPHHPQSVCSARCQPSWEMRAHGMQGQRSQEEGPIVQCQDRTPVRRSATLLQGERTRDWRREPYGDSM